MKERWGQDQNQAAYPQEQRQVILAQKREELVRMMGDLKKMQEDLRKQARPDIRALQDHVERLQRENAELRERAGAAETQALSDENEQLRLRVRELEENAGPALGGNLASQLNDLRAEIDILHEELANKQKALDEMTQKQPGKTDKSLNDRLRSIRNLLTDSHPAGS